MCTGSNHAGIVKQEVLVVIRARPMQAEERTIIYNGKTTSAVLLVVRVRCYQQRCHSGSRTKPCMSCQQYYLKVLQSACSNAALHAV